MSALPINTFLEDAKLKTKFCASMSAVGESDLTSPLSRSPLVTSRLLCLTSILLYMRLRSFQCIILVRVNPLERYFFVAFCY